jgi:multicomponent Na+:H+ antiporter subunit G
VFYIFFLPLIFLSLLVSLTFNSLGTFSLYRFPDVYTRLHGATKCTTFGTIFIAVAVVLYSLGRLLQTGEARFVVLAIHTIVAMFVLLVTNATGAHAIARAAHRSGVLPAKAVVDRLEESREGGESR